MHKKTLGIVLVMFMAMVISGCAATTPYGTSPGQDIHPASSKLTQEGKALYEQGDYRNALEKLDMAYKNNPRDWDALFYRASTYQKLKMYNKAIKDFDKGRAWAPYEESIRFHFALGNAYLEKGDFKRALTTIGYVIYYANPTPGPYSGYLEAYEPYLVPAYILRAKTYLQLGNRKEALYNKAKAIEFDPRLLKEFEGDDTLSSFLDIEKRRAITKQALEAAKQAEASGNLLEAFKQYERAYQVVRQSLNFINRKFKEQQLFGIILLRVKSIFPTIKLIKEDKQCH